MRPKTFPLDTTCFLTRSGVGGGGQDAVSRFIWEEEALIWSAADLMGGDGSPATASESEEERRIQMASLRTWREAGNEPLSSYHRQQAVKVVSFLHALGMFFFEATKHFFFHLLKKIYL